MYKNILVPVSFEGDRNVDQAMLAAQTLASDGARITLLHVVQDVPLYVADYIPSEIAESNQDMIKSKLDALCAKVPNSIGHVKVGHPGNTILAWADDNDVDCIVIASHQPAMSDYLLGSTAQLVVRHAKCCVHVVR